MRMSEEQRERELSRLLNAHANMVFKGQQWAKLYQERSKFAVDHMVWVFNSDVNDISPRTYEVFGDEEIRNGICRRLGRAYHELPDFIPSKKTFWTEFPIWWVMGSLLLVGIVFIGVAVSFIFHVVFG